MVCDVDVLGAQNIKRCYGAQALAVFVRPPSIETLRQRLQGRGTDTAEVIEQRIARAEFELSFADKFDTVIVNDDLATACREVEAAVKEFLAQ